MGEVEPPRAIGLGLLAPQILCRFAPFGRLVISPEIGRLTFQIRNRT